MRVFFGRGRRNRQRIREKRFVSDLEVWQDMFALQQPSHLLFDDGYQLTQRAGSPWKFDEKNIMINKIKFTANKFTLKSFQIKTEKIWRHSFKQK